MNILRTKYFLSGFLESVSIRNRQNLSYSVYHFLLLFLKAYTVQAHTIRKGTTELGCTLYIIDTYGMSKKSCPFSQINYAYKNEQYFLGI